LLKNGKWQVLKGYTIFFLQKDLNVFGAGIDQEEREQLKIQERDPDDQAEPGGARDVASWLH
jgi:hypothetical protein